MGNKTVEGSTLDPTIKFSTLVVDGIEHKLAYSFNSIAIAESVTGINLLSGVAALFNDIGKDQAKHGASILRGLLYAAMLVAEPKTTLDKAGNLIRLDNITEVIRAIQEAYTLSLPEELPKNVEAATPEKAA